MRAGFVALALLLFGGMACDADGVLLSPVGAGGRGGAGGSGGEAGRWRPSVGAYIELTGGPEVYPCGPMDDLCECPENTHCVCEPDGVCNVQCLGQGCSFECSPFASCDFHCAGGGCSVECLPGSNCHVACEQDCAVQCLGDAICTLWSWQGVSNLYCDLEASCLCDEPMGCLCSGPGCPPEP